MSQQIRQQIITLARELPDESLPEVLAFLHSFTEKSQPKDQSSTLSQAEYNQAMQLYKQGSEKYKNALRELA